MVMRTGPMWLGHGRSLIITTRRNGEARDDLGASRDSEGDAQYETKHVAFGRDRSEKVTPRPGRNPQTTPEEQALEERCQWAITSPVSASSIQIKPFSFSGLTF